MWWFSKTGGENEQPVGGNAEGGNNLPDSRLASQPAASRVLPVGYDTTYMRPPARGTKGRITATDRSRYYLHQMLDSNQRFFDEDATASIEMQDYDDNDPNPQAPQQGHNRRGHDRDNDLLDRFLASEGDHFAHEQGGVLLTPHSYEDIVTSASCRSDTSGIVLTEKDDADAAKKGRKPPARDVSTKSMGGVSHPQGMKPRGGEGDAKPVFVDEKGDVSAAKKHGNVFSRLGNSREIAEQLGEDDEELARKIAENEGGARPSMRKGGYGFRTKTLMDLEKEVTSERYRATRGSSSMFADTGAGRMMEEALLGRSMQQGVFNALAHGGATRSAARPATPAELLVKKIYTTEQIDPEGPLGKCLTTGAAYMPTREERMDERFAWFRSRWASTNTVEMDPLLSWEDKLRIAFRNIQHWLDIYSDVVFTAVLVASWSLFLHVYDVGFIGIGPIEPNFFMETLKLPPALFGIFSGVISFLLVIRVNLSYARWWSSRQDLEGFSTHFYLCTLFACTWDQFTVTTGKDHYIFRRRLIGLMSMLHAKCCETLRDAYESPSLGDWWLEDVAVDFFNKQPIGQELIAAGTSIEPLRDRSAQVYTWILMLLSGRFFKCHFVPPPLLNMLFTNLNAGMMRFHSALTVKNTEFPSPFTEIVTNLSTLMGFLIPIVIHPLLDFMVWKFLLCMVGMYGYMVTAAVAKMLQDPFGEDEFDHSVDQYQIDFDLCMMDVCDKMSYHTPFPSVRRMGHKVPRYNKPDGEPIDIFLREQADVIRWNTAAPKAPELRVGVTRGALRAIQRKRQEKDSFSSDDSCIPFENELKPRRRAQLLEEQEKRLAERKKRKDDLEKLAMQRRMVRAVMKIEALAILHFHFKYGRDDFGTEGRVASLERKRLAALANQVEESEESAPGTYRRFGAKKGELDHIPGRSRTSVARHRADREK